MVVRKSETAEYLKMYESCEINAIIHSHTAIKEPFFGEFEYLGFVIFEINFVF